MSQVRVAVIGCTGRMGRALLRLLREERDMQLAAAVTIPTDTAIGVDAGTLAGGDPLGLPVSDAPPNACDVAIEFTDPGGVRAWSQWCAGQGVALVSGTTGLADPERALLAQAAKRVPVLWSPNMSIGVHVLNALVRRAAELLSAGWDVELVESHHRAKADAPSGTARLLIEALTAARPGARVVHGRSGTPGPRAADEIGVHALRLCGVVGDNEVHFGSAGEVVSLSHRALSRDVFAAGALRAARWLAGRPPGLYTMEQMLGA